jgi:hypothetical protein
MMRAQHDAPPRAVPLLPSDQTQHAYLDFHERGGFLQGHPAAVTWGRSLVSGC